MCFSDIIFVMNYYKFQLSTKNFSKPYITLCGSGKLSHFSKGKAISNLSGHFVISKSNVLVIYPYEFRDEIVEAVTLFNLKGVFFEYSTNFYKTALIKSIEVK